MGLQMTVFVGDAELDLEQAFNLCGGCLLCQASRLHAHVLLDFVEDFGIIAPELFLNRLLADALSESSKLHSTGGAWVRLPSKRTARPRRARMTSTTLASEEDGMKVR